MFLAVPVFSAERRLGALPARHLIFLLRKLLAPFRVCLLDLLGFFFSMFFHLASSKFECLDFIVFRSGQK